MEKMSVRPGRKVCEAMRGLVEEAQHEIEEHAEKGPILDLIIVAGMQRMGPTSLSPKPWGKRRWPTFFRRPSRRRSRRT